MAKKAPFSIILLFFLTACLFVSLPAVRVSTPPPPSLPVQPELPTASAPSSAETALSEPTLTPAPSLTSEPVYDPALVGDVGKLESYVLTTSGKFLKGTQPGGGGSTNQVKFSVIKSPLQAELITSRQELAVGATPAHNSDMTSYMVGDMYYRLDKEGGGFWFIRKQDEYDKYYFTNTNSPLTLAQVKRARFVGVEQYGGVPANHFVFDKSGWEEPASDHPNQTESFQGNLYLALDGNYPIHLDYHWTGSVWLDPQNNKINGDTYQHQDSEYSADLTMMNKVKEIAMPKDIPLQVSTKPDLPLPEGLEGPEIMVWPHGPPYDYEYFTDLTDDQILAFYQTLSPDTGWTVLMAAKDPDGQGGIIRIQKDGKIVMLGIGYFAWRKKTTLSLQFPP